MSKLVHTRTFKSGNSVAVRLPKAFAIPEGAEIELEHVRGTVTMRVVRDPEEEKARLRKFLDDLAALPKPPEIQNGSRSFSRSAGACNDWPSSSTATSSFTPRWRSMGRIGNAAASASPAHFPDHSHRTRKRRVAGPEMGCRKASQSGQISRRCTVLEFGEAETAVYRRFSPKIAIPDARSPTA